MSVVITPNAALKLRKIVRESHATYAKKRSAFLAAKAADAHIVEIDDLLHDALEARFWYWTDRRRLESAWLPRGLKNVQTANKKR